MSDIDYMNAEQLAFFKDRLLTMKDEIEANIESFRQELSELRTEADENELARLNPYGLQLYVA